MATKKIKISALDNAAAPKAADLLVGKVGVNDVYRFEDSDAGSAQSRAMTAGTTLNFQSKSFLGSQSVEFLDFSGSRIDHFSMTLDQAVVDQADGGNLRVKIGTNDIQHLDLSGIDTGVVTFYGEGRIQLADAARGEANRIRIGGTDRIDVAGGAGSDAISGSDGDNVISGGGGRDFLRGNGGADTFVFSKGGAGDSVLDFKVGEDKLQLDGLGVHDMTDVMSHATALAGGGVRLDFGNGDTIDLAGVDLKSLSTATVSADGHALDPVIRIGTGVSATELNAIIAKAAAGSTILLENGEHVFDQSIVVKRGDITLRGESESGTVVKFDFAASKIADAIQVVGGATKALGTLTADTQQSQSFVDISTVAGLKIGDHLYISQANDAELRSTHLYDNVPLSYWNDEPLRETMVEITRIEGNRVFFDSTIQQDFRAGKATVSTVDLLHDVRLSDFTVTYDLGPVKSSYYFENMLPAYLDTSALALYGTDDARVANISIIDAASHSFDFRRSIDLSADNLHTDGSHNKGTYGSGYGVQLYELYDSTLTNLTLMNNRHALLFSSWHAEANNFVEIADTNRDVNFHGGIDRGNTVIVDHQVLDYKPWLNNGITEGVWNTTSPGGPHHPDTNIFGDNTILHKYAVAYTKDDEIHGVDSGAYLDGGAGNDTIYGGVGDDTLFGREGNDTIIGGAGDDTIDGGANANVLKGEGGDDRILGGSGNDSIEGGTGDDTIIDTGGANTLDGGAGNDSIVGGTGKDTLFGGDGNDTLRGGDNQDIIWTGNGHDVVDVWTGDHYDTVKDFDVHNDMIRIHTDAAHDSFAELKIEAYNGGTRISYDDPNGDWGRIVLENVSVSQVKADLFVFDTVA